MRKEDQSYQSFWQIQRKKHMPDKEIPNPEDIQKEFEDFVKNRFGGQVKVIAHELPFSAKTQRKASNEAPEAKPIDLNFDWKPKELKAYLDRYVIGQDEAKKALSIAICDHYNQVRSHLKDPDDPSHEHYVKQNILILGPTGVGKTFMVRQIAKLIGVPFVKADATRFSETGYIGANVDDLIRDLVAQAQGDLQKAQYGMIYLDEADKLATRGSTSGRDVSGRGVQMGLLKLMEETDVDLRANHDPASQFQAFMEMQQKGKVEKHPVNTKHILFIVSGAFSGIEQISKKRLSHSQIGFTSPEQSGLTRIGSDQLATSDFVDFGFEPEFIGRIPVRVACHELDAEALFSILKDSEGSVIRQYQKSFQAYGIDLKFTDGALRLIASMTCEEKTGARGLLTTLERIMRNYKYHLPSTDILECLVTEDMIKDPERFFKSVLDAIKEDARKEIRDIKEYEKDFENRYGMKISFDSDAVQYLIQHSREKNLSVTHLCAEILQSFEHGLKLISQNTGQSEFLITKTILVHPRQSLEKMVKESYNCKEEDRKENVQML